MAFGSAPAKPADGNYRAGCIGFAVLSLVLAAAMAVYYVAEKGGNATAQNEVRILLDSQTRAWNSGNLADFTATYRLDDGVTFYSEGRIYKGWEELNERYRTMYAGRPMGQLEYKDVAIDVLNFDAVLLRGKWTVVSDAGTRTGLFTMLARKFPEGWKIVHDHTTIGELR